MDGYVLRTNRMSPICNTKKQKQYTRITIRNSVAANRSDEQNSTIFKIIN